MEKKWPTAAIKQINSILNIYTSQDLKCPNISNLETSQRYETGSCQYVTITWKIQNSFASASGGRER